MCCYVDVVVECVVGMLIKLLWSVLLLCLCCFEVCCCGVCCCGVCCFCEVCDDTITSL